MKHSRMLGTACALMAFAAFVVVPASAGQKGGGGHGGGGGNTYNTYKFQNNNNNWNNNRNSNRNYNTNTATSRSNSSSYSTSNSSSQAAGGAATIVQSFKFGGGTGANVANGLFGVAAVIGAMNPPEGQKIYVRGGDVKVEINFIGEERPRAAVYREPQKGEPGYRTRRTKGKIYKAPCNASAHEDCVEPPIME